MRSVSRQKRDTALTVPIEMLWSPPMKMGSVPSRSRSSARSWISPVQAPTSPKVLAAQREFARVGRMDRRRKRHVSTVDHLVPQRRNHPRQSGGPQCSRTHHRPCDARSKLQRNPQQGYRLPFACLFHAVLPAASRLMVARSIVRMRNNEKPAFGRLFANPRPYCTIVNAEWQSLRVTSSCQVQPACGSRRALPVPASGPRRAAEPTHWRCPGASGRYPSIAHR